MTEEESVRCVIVLPLDKSQADKEPKPPVTIFPLEVLFC